MSTYDVIMIALGIGLILVVAYVQSTGHSAGSYLKNRQRRRDAELEIKHRPRPKS